MSVDLYAKTCEDTKPILANANVTITIAVDMEDRVYAVLCFDAPVAWLRFDHEDLGRLIEQLQDARKHLRAVN